MGPQTTLYLSSLPRPNLLEWKKSIYFCTFHYTNYVDRPEEAYLDIFVVSILLPRGPVGYGYTFSFGKS